MYSIAMKGYYTVELTSMEAPVHERITLEALYAEALESELGGHERATRALLEAGTQEDGRNEIRNALETAEVAVRAKGYPGARFAVRAWAAFDL
jgi:hypothetical protein